ncbi:hypothetical protein [Pseudomonas phage PA1C]|uniref:Uncharacterized protein n=1 Tax=Pseudomonas phage vB_PaeM_PS119XW TaxID=2601632 RepID=A0A5C1K6X8_9CAUD|nr:hypothetical protein PP933_gp027 [Pseudomonas phage vB_PaeM_PS119XW]QBX32177.1 hypothetical protein [Pseudomonas phage PA1C]QEM41756.1 hypothetical protein [Pseudomonas phage vB_PaeM_PS119XW]
MKSIGEALPAIKDIFKNFLVIENVDEITFGAVHPVTNDIFLKVSEWNVTQEDFELTYKPSETNIEITKQNLGSFFSAIGQRNTVHRLGEHYQKLIELMIAEGYKFFDVQSSWSFDTAVHSVSYYKPSEWIKQEIGRITFYSNDRVYQPLVPENTSSAIKHVEVDEYCRPKTITFLDLNTLKVSERHEFDFESIPKIYRITPTIRNFANLDNVSIVNTMVHDNCTVTLMVGYYLGVDVQVKVYLNSFKDQELVLS